MTAPTLQGTPTTGGRAGSGTFTVNLPSGAEGYVLAVAGNGGTFNVGTPTTGGVPTGWTLIGEVERTGSGGRCFIYTGTAGAATSWEAFDSSTNGPIAWTVTGFNSDVVMSGLTTPGNQNTTSPSITTTATCYTMRGVFDMSDPTSVATYPTAATLGRSNARYEHPSEGWWATVALAYQNDTTIGSSGTASWSINGSYEPVAFTAQVTAIVVPDAPTWDIVSGSERALNLEATVDPSASDLEYRWRCNDLTPPSVSTQASAPAHLDRLDDATGLDGTYTYTYDGAGVRVYILDSGVRYTHNEFTGRTAPGYSLQSAYDDDSTHNHGTGVAAMAAGTIYGAAKAATVISITIDGSEDEVPASQLSDAAAWIATDRAGAPAVAVLASGFDGEASPSGPMLAALQEFWDQGVVLVNSGVGEGGSPFPDVDNGLVIVAGASDHTTDAKASYSGYGPGFDLYAPIGTTTTASSTSNSATRSAGGTSEAAPLIAGVIAKILHANPALQPARVREVLFSQARQDVISGILSGPNRLLNGNANTDQWSVGAPSSETFTLDGFDDGRSYSVQMRQRVDGVWSDWSESGTASTAEAAATAPPIQVGPTQVDAIYVGDNPVTAIYRGSTLVWSAS